MRTYTVSVRKTNAVACLRRICTADMSTSSTAPLFNPLKLGPLTLQNRIVMSALTRNRSVPTNVPNALNLEYYIQRAKGGAGLITSEGTLISSQGTEWQHAPGIWSKEQVAGWKKITDGVHAAGSLIYCQLWHVGRVAHPDAPEQHGKPVDAPSAISARGGKFRFLPGVPGYQTPTSIDNPRRIVDDFKQAAINAKEAGFDGVELHGANGYLVHQFLDSTSNVRTDSYGGSVENRARFALEVLEALIEVFGADRVGIKLSPAGGYNDMGMPLQETLDTFGYLITAVDNLHIAYIELVRYVAAFDVTFDGKLRATQHDVLAAYGPLIKNTKVFLNGGLTPAEAAALVEAGKIDAAVFGWIWIGHPDVAKRVRYGKPLDAQVDPKTLYDESDHNWVGYTDYPEAQYA
ncbi:hypothetical protein PLICRDRAFT_156167 [Plicaturopsis crispa FD-325 SS-3]|nr:hypothetical protein PLICRDRAFT_156167 [Plicaturopsis crispa FD-325 SS-3]